MILTAHQPNFCPWLPYFQKIEQADVFVILGQPQYEKGGFQNRFNVGDNWYTMSVNKGLTPIHTKQYVNVQHDWKKITRSFPQLRVFDQQVMSSLYTMNSCIIMQACKIQGIKTDITFDLPTRVTGTERLVELCKEHNATTYLSGISGKKYLDIKLFHDAGVNVILP